MEGMNVIMQGGDGRKDRYSVDVSDHRPHMDVRVAPGFGADVDVHYKFDSPLM